MFFPVNQCVVEVLSNVHVEQLGNDQATKVSTVITEVGNEDLACWSATASFLL
jgi:hypothetical protein